MTKYLTIREKMQDQLMLPGMQQDEKQLPFLTMVKDSVKYKVFGIVTNMDWDGQELIKRHYKRYGRSEQAHRDVGRLGGRHAAEWGFWCECGMVVDLGFLLQLF